MHYFFHFRLQNHLGTLHKCEWKK